MKKNAICPQLLSIVGIFMILSNCISTNSDQFPDPKIKMGIAKVSGKIIGISDDEDQKVVTIFIQNPVTAETTK